MPKQPDWLESLSFDVLTDAALDTHERQRRTNVLHDIATRIQQDGAHVAQPHTNRARQFMPFAALKGYHELARQREHVPEQKHTMTEERSVELSEAISRLKKGCMASITHYEDDRYTTTCGIVSEVDQTFRTISIVKTKIAFDNIFSIKTSD